ncbi:MAG: NrsF family protein [Dehalococcoidia bacterium]
MTTDDLITSLVRDLRPVRPLDLPLVRLRRWLVIAIAAVVMGVAAFGLRRDASAALGEWQLPVDSVMLALVAGLSAAAALRLSVPGERAPSQAVSVVLALGWLGSLWWASWHTGGLAPGPGLARVLGGGGWWCSVQQALIGAACGGVLLAMVNRGVALERGRVAALIALSAAAAGAMTSEWTCASSGPLHLLVWHAGGAALFVVTGSAAGLVSLSQRTAARPWARPRA